MTTAIYWFRNDLRLSDNPAFTQACRETAFLLPIYIVQPLPKEDLALSFPKISKLRTEFLEESLHDLSAQLLDLGSNLFKLEGDVIKVFQDLRVQLNTNTIYCEEIQSQEELSELAILRQAGFEVKSIWQSSMLDPRSLPFELEEMPAVFTQFRLRVEKHKLKFTTPLESPTVVAPLPEDWELLKDSITIGKKPLDTTPSDKTFHGGEGKALAHIKQYFDRRLADTYKKTRNELIGMDYSSKFSPWLALGCCSARTIAKRLTEYEDQFGANDGTYWLWFELLWRDYFRFLSFKTAKDRNPLKHFSTTLGAESDDRLRDEFRGVKFKRWSTGYTGDTFIDAGMRELLCSGYLSNRMRQVVASYWIYNLKGDWEVGAAWFRSQLLDYDVYSNQGNWQYIAGNGAEHQGGRQFNIAKQTQDHDPNGIYRKIWLA